MKISFDSLKDEQKHIEEQFSSTQGILLEKRNDILNRDE
jgi:hypothetical protein